MTRNTTIFTAILTLALPLSNAFAATAPSPYETLKAEVVGAQKALEAAGGTDAALTQKVTEAKLKLATAVINGTDLYTVDTRSEANKKAIAELKTKVTTNETALVNNAQTLTQTTVTLTATQNKVNALAPQVTANQTKATALQQTVTAQGAAIGQNDQLLKANQAALAALSAPGQDVTALNRQLDQLDDEMKRGLAMQAALSGLFQPYSIGKYNLTASVGGYESEQALAVGSGYRFNETFAMKAGVSTDINREGGVAYHVSGNIEF